MQLNLEVMGNRRLAENLILEVKALASRFGLETSQVTVRTQPAANVTARSARKRRGARVIPLGRRRRPSKGTTAASGESA